MKRRFIIPEDKLNKLLGVIMNEQMGSNAAPARDAQVKMVTTTAKGAGLFKIGSADPNPNDPQWQKLTQTLVDTLNNTAIKKPINVIIQGSASAIPFANDPQGQKNVKLANDRGNTTKEYLIQNIDRQKTSAVDSSFIKFTVKPGVVGKATKKGPEADAEQSVSMTYPTSAIGATNPTTARDTTATGTKPFLPGNTIVSANGSKSDVEKTVKGMKPIVIRSSDGKNVYKFTQAQYDEVNKLFSKYNMFMPSAVIIQQPATGGKPSL